jgi:hypothetical protein
VSILRAVGVFILQVETALVGHYLLAAAPPLVALLADPEDSVAAMALALFLQGAYQAAIPWWFGTPLGSPS